ncbi:MAG: hypothetical protein CVU13_11650 [Bacteroidetes bacterium HGW-Bacteroidetes-8]|jgi:poly-gamma-glutamate synthesis protein (capsule biosynthesis protein)|nr:MAG: hypothetical protein CVU13_11650 [Bacteroidetes bacterium HGW-Bacteroidetes-8]
MLNFFRKQNLWLKILILATVTLLLLIFTFYAVIWDSSDADEIDFRNFRAEGLSFYEAAPSGIKYFKKYYFKSWNASDSTKLFFAKQSQLNRSLKSSALNEKESLSISFVGDIMWIRNGWSSFVDDSVRRYLSKSDMVFGNLETPIDTLSDVPALLPDYTNYNSKPDLIRSFRREQGGNVFTALSIANNHTLDKGHKGLERTLKFLEKEGILVTGARAGSAPGDRDYLFIEKSGVRVGFYAATWGLNDPELLRKGDAKINQIYGIAPLHKEKIDLASKFEILKKMREDSVDIKILFLHWGYEYELYPDEEIIKIGRKLSEAGADLIIGSHSHVVQPSEICLGNGYKLTSDSLSRYYYKFNDSTGVPRKSLIVYSLGNFTSAMYTSLCRLGLIQNVTLYKNSQTGLWDWTLGESLFVYNNPAGIAGLKRKLVFYKDYIESLSLKSPEKGVEINTEVRSVLQLYN